ncbi:trypsin-like serine protease [Polaromonas sp. P1(28)-13]|nr:trypsin-like serine protease [Polaromonas sp. P1(28)-13]
MDDAIRGCSGVRGYVQREHVVAANQLRRSPERPIDLSAFGEPVPRLWEAIGIKDSRYLVTQRNQHPFNAVAFVFPSSCTAFFVAPSILVTAQHCYTSEHTKSPLQVFINRPGYRAELLDAEVIAQGGDSRTGDEHSAHDWMLIKTRTVPKVPIEPLKFAEVLPHEAAVIEALVVGYPADQYNPAKIESAIPVATSCHLTVSEIKSGDTLHKTEPHLAIRPQPRHCVIWGGIQEDRC